MKGVAKAIADTLRRPGELVGRYGGEEFAVILPGTPPEGGKVVAERIRENVYALNMPHEASTTADRVTVSIGVATMVPDEIGSVEGLLSLADQALYQAKESGRNRVEASPIMEVIDHSD